MKTIKYQVFFIVLAGIFTASVVIGGFGVFWSSTAVKRSSAKILDLMAQAQTVGLDSMFFEVEQSSTVLAHYVRTELENIGDLANEAKFSGYFSHLVDLSHYISRCTAPAMALYVKFSPKLTNETKSFLWRKKDGILIQDSLKNFPIPDLDFDNSWYYHDGLFRNGVWTAPYYNEDFNEYVISYGIPVFKDEKLIALVGMDIDFDDIASVVNSITIYNSGYAFLTDESFKVVYHRSVPAGTKLFEYSRDFKLIENSELNSSFYEYKNNGKKYRMLYKELESDLLLVVSVPAEEIDHERTKLIYSLIISVIVISLLVSLWSVWMSDKFTRPLKKLSFYAKNIIAGVYDVEFDFKSNDEVGELTGNFAFMAKSLKRQFEYINNLAYLDAMTGVKNKRAYIDARDEMNEKIRRNKVSNLALEFGVIVFDVNNLKNINDSFGHKAGDLLIKCACNLISKTFIYSTIYRIGGDEFVAIITGKDFENKEELLADLRLEMAMPVAEKNEAFERISIASGLAVYDPKSDEDFQSVFERADGEMYKSKIAMKGGRGLVR
ncbi:diguanylate cyclase [Treponema ruminis]|uniref:diguanylate cyclase n=1 Tax=Treponema ruminis TaxID=744515 RepID=A0A7W8G950_9SPIR|nr:diguanylate cyclase [Treponema ruminis]MBB5226019.1 diguanylate cyclase (GGDEF)-like protein [Treponema ruminis]QSI03071.1 diguanylate cyclase [Treponema ruminis]